MNEADSVFSKEGSVVEVPYVEPSFGEVLMSSPWSEGLMEYERMICGIFACYMKYVICCVQYEKNDDACYSHSMIFLIRFVKSTDLTFHNSCR